MSSTRLKHGDSFKPKLIALSVAACFGLSAAQTFANPTGGRVASGSASFSASGNTLTITNTAGTIINWQSFSIGVNEITRFLQSSSSSTVLNRVVGKNGVVPQSVIDGVLSSNGRVFLLNSSGILFGQGARIDVAGLVASSLNLSNQDFRAGKMRFTETPGTGTVSNEGVIDTTSSGPGGRVFLIGKDVKNSGIIRTPQGQIVLAAGKSVELVSENSPFVTVTVTADTERALNLGKLIADSGRIGMFGGLVRQGGVAEANGAVVGANGEIRLVATNTVIFDAGSVTSASGGAQGGKVEVSGPGVIQAGDIRADGNAGGSVRIDAGQYIQAGTVSASGGAGAGGSISVSAPHVTQTASALLAADGNGGDGGSISVDASGAPDGVLFSSGSFSATGDRGGDIKLLGRGIVLLGASADASGANGGGSILVGGDFHGANPAVANASTTAVNYSTTLKADATQNGDGGKIVVWSDRDTQFYGTASARGGAQSGNGGSLEISGHESLTMGGFADAGAANGAAGSVLFDPKNIIIDNIGGSGTFGSFQLVDPNSGLGGSFGQEVFALSNQNLVVTAPNEKIGANTNAGAVYLFNSTTGGLISALTGSSANDHVGQGVTSFAGGASFIVQSPNWTNAGLPSAGAVTLVNGTTGLSGAVSSANSLVGSTANDLVGSFGIAPVGTGNYVVISPSWHNGLVASAGAVTYANVSTGAGVTGTVSAANSLVGSTLNDQVGNSGVFVLPNGNYLVISPNWTLPGAAAPSVANVGAVTFANGNTGRTGTITSANSLVGSTANDQVGLFGVDAVGNGANYVVLSPFWNNGAVTHAGAVTFGSGTTGVSGTVSATNSLVGSTINDQVGQFGTTEVGNGNFVVFSPNWNINSTATLAGAVTFGNGTTGAGMTGVVSSANSLVGGSAFDQLGSGGVVALTNGNYVVVSPNWTQPGAAAPSVANVGAVTWVDGTNGNIAGTASPGGNPSVNNSLVGTLLSDRVGIGGVTPLPNGNYVVNSSVWNNGAGAVTWGDGAAGTRGAVSATNSLVGSTAGDQVGGRPVLTLIGSSNYVVNSPTWTDPQTQTGAVGAVTFVDGTTGNIAGTASRGGAVSSSNSLVGSTPNDQVGSGGVLPLANGSYVVLSPTWSAPGATPLTNAGAVTWVNGTNGNIAGGTVPGGAVSSSNSLVGGSAGDAIGSNGIVPLIGNDRYVVVSADWTNPQTQAPGAGAVTLIDGTNGNIVASGAPGGVVTASNSLVGAAQGDSVGLHGVMPLLNGNYVVISSDWTNPQTNAPGAGAVTFGKGTTGVVGLVSDTNSLVGTATGDNIGSDPQFGAGGVVPLFGTLTGNYVVVSPAWNGGRGAVTLGNGTTGIVGAVSPANSLVGTTPNQTIAGDNVGSGGITEIAGGNYVVSSPNWNNGAATNAGAVTWVNGTSGSVFGQTVPGAGAAVSVANSLVGGTTNDHVGQSGQQCECVAGVENLPGGGYAVLNQFWTNPSGAAANAGAVSFSGPNGIAGLVSSSNSVVGTSANDRVGSNGLLFLGNGGIAVMSPSFAGGAGAVHIVTPGGAPAGDPATGQTFNSNPSGDVTITPATIAAITDTGTGVVLQANNDITVKAGVTTSPGVSLTMQAGRSVFLNSNISTSNGNLTITANELASAGVDPANRDAGTAVIQQAAGTTLNAGSGTITITMANGAGRTAPNTADSGAISLANVATSGNLSILNDGTGTAAAADIVASGVLTGTTLAKLTSTNGALGSTVGALQVGTTKLQASAATGINIVTNLFAPAMVNVIALANRASGNVVLNAHGGATTPTSTLVSNPGGNVTINSFSPLDIGGGITAGNSIFLSTAGTSSGATNDMSLAGLYTYNVSTGAFEVTVGVGGALTLFTGSTPLVLTAPLFPNPVNITHFTFLQDTGSLQLDANTVINATNKLAKTDTPFSIDDLEKKGKDGKKKEAVACK